MLFLLQKYALTFLKNTLINLENIYIFIVLLIYNNIKIYILMFKESFVVDYLQKLYVVKFILTWCTSIGIYFENFGINYIISKINKLFNIDLHYISNVWFNFFIQTYFIFFIFNIYLIVVIFF